MFDIGWSELVAIGLVALIVIGPKELPTVLRTAGQWMGKIKRMASEFQGQFQEALREAEVADLKEQASDLTKSLKSLTDYDPLADTDKDKSASDSDTEASTDWDELPHETPEHTEPAAIAADETHAEPVAVAEATSEHLPIAADTAEHLPVATDTSEHLPVVKPETLPEPLPATPVAVVETAPSAEITALKPPHEPAEDRPAEPPPKQAGGSA